MIVTQHFLDTLLVDARAAGKILDPSAVWVGLGTAVASRGVNTLLSDITEVATAGYARTAITAWQNVSHKPDGRSALEGELVIFAPFNADAAYTAACWFLADAETAGNLLGFGLITPNVPLPDQFSTLSIVPVVTSDPNGRWSAEVIFGP